jgi:hypothetical protein
VIERSDAGHRPARPRRPERRCFIAICVPGELDGGLRRRLVRELTIDGVIVEGCRKGLVVAGPSNERTGFAAQISNCQLIDNRFGLVSSHAFSNIHDIVIRDDESTPQVSEVGISIDSGLTFLAGVEITGQDEVGLAVGHSPSDNLSAGAIGDGLRITGGRVGISFSGIDNSLRIRNSIVRDQTEASLFVSNLDGVTDFGSPSDPGHNELSVVSGFAIDDFRFTETPGRYIRGTGTTLNGMSFDGQTVDGPAELAPFYRFRHGDAGIQF